MKLIINDYEVTITAKYRNSERGNKHDTAAVLNTLSIYATEASTEYHRIGAHSLAERAAKVGNDIYQYLEEHGFYKQFE